MSVAFMGTNIAKHVFQLHGVNRQGKVLVKKRLFRSAGVKFMANVPACAVGIEVCGNPNYWSRKQ